MKNIIATAIKALMAGIAKFGGSAWQGAKTVGRIVAKPFRYVFGKNGEVIPQPQETEFVEEKVAEPLPAPGWNSDPEADGPEIVERAFGHPAPGETYGVDAQEPFDVLNFAKADSIGKREEIAKKMRGNTLNWLTSNEMKGKGLEALAKATKGDIQRHLENKGHIPGVPKFDFGKVAREKKIEFAQEQKPEIDQREYNMAASHKLDRAINGFKMGGPVLGKLDGFELKAAARKEAMEMEDREELENTRAPRPPKLAGMRR